MSSQSKWEAEMSRPDKKYSCVEGVQLEFFGNVKFSVVMSRGRYRTSCVSAELFRGRRSTLEASAWKSLKRMTFWRQVCGWHVVSKGSLTSKLQFWACKLHLNRKSRRTAWLFSLQIVYLKEISQKRLLSGQVVSQPASQSREVSWLCYQSVCQQVS